MRDVLPGSTRLGAAILDRPRARLITGCALFVLALGLRGLHLDRTGLDHGDEGMYVLSADGFGADSLYGFQPEQIYHAPPLYVITVAGVKALVGIPADRAAIVTNVVAGSLTVVLVWWIAAAWAGPAVGLGAGILLAFSQFHISLSRSGLTDVLFALLLLLGFYLTVEACRKLGWWRIASAGVVVGLAWNTKYHGILAAVSAVPALFAAMVWGQGERRLEWRSSTALAAIALVAGLCMLPWGLFILSQTSATEFLQYYDRYVDRGAGAIIGRVSRQAMQQMYWSGPLDQLGFWLVALGVILASARRGVTWPLAGLTLASAVVAFSGESWLALVALSVVGAWWLCRERPGLRGWGLIAFGATWAVLTPLYEGYARLALPLVLACYIFGTVGICSVAAWGKGRSWLTWPSLGVLLVGVVVSLRAADRRGDPWQRSDGMIDTADRIAEIVPPDQPVYAEAVLAYYLGQRGYAVFLEATDAFLAREGSVYVALGGELSGPQAERYFGIPERRQARLVDSIARRPPNHRVLDLYRPPFPKSLPTDQPPFVTRVYLYELVQNTASR